jgi:sec-independent protein translocase protein TatA
MFGLGMTEIMVLLVLGVLLFGKRLPEVGRSVGKMLVEFKKGISGFEQHLESGDFSFRQDTAPPTAAPVRPPQKVAPSGQKFEDAPPGPSSPIV